MRHIPLIFIGAMLLANCNNPQTNNPVASNTTPQVIDSSKKDTIREKKQEEITDPFRAINNFDLKFGDPFIDSLHTLYSKNGKVTAFVKDICLGDNCESWQIIVNKKENTTLYLFKGDGSEYGFSNDQFLLKNDSLVYVRNFTVNIDTWPTDSTETRWKIEEVIYHFQDSASYTTTRTVFTKAPDHFDFTLRGVKAKTSKEFNFEKSYAEKSLELEKLLEMKDSPDRD